MPKTRVMLGSGRMTRADLLAFLRGHKLAVVASVSADGQPQAAVVGIAVSDTLEIVFDTVSSSRKYQNLRRDSRVGVVIGWDREVTVQIDGIADFPSGAELDRIRVCYFAAYPDGRDRLSWPGITHVRIRPTWLRLSDFTQNPPQIIERRGEEVA
jgi:PPOX class probable F420-dependent enzyme